MVDARTSVRIRISVRVCVSVKATGDDGAVFMSQVSVTGDEDWDMNYFHILVVHGEGQE